MIDKEKFLALVTDKDTFTLTQNTWRIDNRQWLRKSQEIAILILERMDTLDWNVERLAEALQVSPEEVAEWLKGSENFNLETLTKLEDVLDIHILNLDVRKK